MAQGYRQEEVKAGAVILISLAVLAAIITLVSRGGLQATPREYRVEFTGVGGLEEGAQVRFGGVKVGRVLRIQPPGKDSPRVQVVIGLRRDVVLRNGTEAAINTLGLVGEHYIELTNPRPAPGEIPPGGLVMGRDQPSMAELLAGLREVGEAAKGLMGRVQALVDGPVQDLVRRAGHAMTAGERVLGSVAQTLSAENREDLRRVLASLRGLLEENRGPIRAATADLGALIRHVDGMAAEGGAFLRRLDGPVAQGSALMRRLDDAVAAGSAFLRKLDAAVDEKGGDLRGTLVVLKADLERAKEVLENMDRAVTNFDRAVTGNLDTIEETLADLRRSASNAKELTQTLKERPWRIIFPESLKDRDAAR